MKREQMTPEKIQIFEKLIGQIDGLHNEIALTSKKAPNDAINTFKLKFINNILDQWNNLLGEQFKPFSDFEQFSSEDLPTNSDVTLMLAQYIEAAEIMRTSNIYCDLGDWYWRGHKELETYPPRKLTSR